MLVCWFGWLSCLIENLYGAHNLCGCCWVLGAFYVAHIIRSHKRTHSYAYQYQMPIYLQLCDSRCSCTTTQTVDIFAILMYNSLKCRMMLSRPAATAHSVRSQCSPYSDSISLSNLFIHYDDDDAHFWNKNTIQPTVLPCHLFYWFSRLAVLLRSTAAHSHETIWSVLLWWSRKKRHFPRLFQSHLISNFLSRSRSRCVYLRNEMKWNGSIKNRGPDGGK